MRHRYVGTLIASVLQIQLAAAASAQPPGGPPAGPPGGPPSATVEVDCTAGDSIQAALGNPARELTIEIRGICEENVLIRRQRVTLIGSDPATDGIRGVGPADLPEDGVLRVVGTRAVRLENLAILDGAARGLAVQASTGVEVVNCRVEGHARDGVQVTKGSFASITDTAILDVGRIALSGFQADLAICNRCTIAGTLFGVAAINGSRISVTDSTIDADLEGVISDQGGSFVGLVNTSVVAGSFALDAFRIADITMTGGSLSGSLFASNSGMIRLQGTPQTSSPAGFNFFGANSFGLLQGGSSLLGPVVVDQFARLLVQSGSTIAGDLVCGSGADAFCSDPATVSGTSSCGQCLGAPLGAQE